MKEHIYLYHTNDLHSYFDHWPQVATILKEKRAKREAKKEHVFTIDIGDHMDRVHPITEATMGKANIDLLNDLNYDFVTLGNNEGITLSYDHLYHLYDDAQFKVVCANLKCMKDESPSWLTCHEIREVNPQLKIGFFGLTAPFNPYYHELGWHVNDPIDTIKEELKEWSENVDIIVLLSHLGMYDDEEIAQQFPEIDVIIGGHTHHLFREGEVVNQTLLAACGKHCSHVGEIELVWDYEQNKLLSKHAQTFEVEDHPKDLLTKQNIAQLMEDANFILNKPVAHLDERLSISWFRDTKLMNEFTNELQEWTKADCAILNAGLLLDELAEGNVSYGEIHRICPHPINAVVVTLTGQELKMVLERSRAKEFIELKLKGFGFRGELIGKMATSQLDIKWKDNKVVSLTLANKQVKDDSLYKVATGDLFTFGNLLPEIAKAKERKLLMPEFIRDILLRTVMRIS